ncbi:MAG: 2-hydroxyacid dehydrogenase [Candidatus Sigynarchaeota archaeon]
MANKPRVYITTTVFGEIARNPLISATVRNQIDNAWADLRQVADVIVFNGRFPDSAEIKKQVEDPRTRFIGCHLSHKIDAEWLVNSNVVAVCTATMGFDHVGQAPGVLITHTPGVLNLAVGDYTIALIETALRNTNGLHERVWSGEWTKNALPWDLDGDISRSLDGQVLGIIGLGEIGLEVARRVQPWNVKILYYDIARREDAEKQFKMGFRPDMKSIFKEADIVSLHIPLNKETKGIVNESLLSEMKDGSLLVNTARGGILNTADLIALLDSGKKKINFATDVYETEPIPLDILDKFKAIKRKYPELRFVFMPHNASADGNTRGTMAKMLLEDLYWLIKSKRIEDLKKCRIIAPQKRALFDEGKVNEFRISKYWKEK